MILIDGVKYACERCVRGHRVSSCQHADQPLTMIKPKGRPTSQCTHCREHRKSKQLHTKCQCGGGKSPHASTCPCAIDADLCTCTKKTSGHHNSSLRRTASNPPSTSRLHTPGGHTTHSSTHHSTCNSPVVRSASTTSLASAGAKSRSASRSRGRSNTTALGGTPSAASLANIAPRTARTDFSQPPHSAQPPHSQRLSHGFDSLDEMFGNSVSAGAPYHLPIHSPNSSSYNGIHPPPSSTAIPPPPPPSQSGADTPSSVQSAFNFPPVDTSNVPFFLDEVDFSTAAPPSSLYDANNGAVSDFDTLTLPSDGEYRVDEGPVFLSSMGDLSDNNNNDVNVMTTNTNSIKLLSTSASASSDMLNSTVGVYGQQQQNQQALQQQLQFSMATTAGSGSGSGNDFLYDFDWSSAGRT